MRDVIRERHKMNMLDLYTREKANQVHLGQIYRETKDQRLLQNANQIRNLEPAQPKSWQRFAIASAAIVIFLVSFMIVTALS